MLLLFVIVFLGGPRKGYNWEDTNRHTTDGNFDMSLLLLFFFLLVLSSSSSSSSSNFDSPSCSSLFLLPPLSLPSVRAWFSFLTHPQSATHYQCSVTSCNTTNCITNNTYTLLTTHLHASLPPSPPPSYYHFFVLLIWTHRITATQGKIETMNYILPATLSSLQHCNINTLPIYTTHLQH